MSIRSKIFRISLPILAILFVIFRSKNFKCRSFLSSLFCIKQSGFRVYISYSLISFYSQKAFYTSSITSKMLHSPPFPIFPIISDVISKFRLRAFNFWLQSSCTILKNRCDLNTIWTSSIRIDGSVRPNICRSVLANGWFQIS